MVIPRQAQGQKKDQTYFLSFDPFIREAGRYLIPLSLVSRKGGAGRKEYSLPVAAKARSFSGYLFCHAENFRNSFERVRGMPGPIVGSSWKLLGRIAGLSFTIGQRRRPGISHPTPLYVLSIDSGQEPHRRRREKRFMCKMGLWLLM